MIKILLQCVGSGIGFGLINLLLDGQLELKVFEFLFHGVFGACRQLSNVIVLLFGGGSSGQENFLFRRYFQVVVEKFKRFQIIVVGWFGWVHCSFFLQAGAVLFGVLLCNTGVALMHVVGSNGKRCFYFRLIEIAKS